MFWELDEVALLFVLLVAFAATIELAFRWGLRHSAGTDDATRAHLNALEIAVLGLLALLLGCFISYNYGLAGRSRHGAMVIFAALIGVVLIVILDLDRPRTGLIQVSEDGMVRLMETIDRK